MSVGGISNSASAAMAAGWRSQLRAQAMKQALDIGGILDPDLAAALASIQQTAHAITAAGAALAQSDMIGQLIDELC